jgi:hypothetical protein
MPTSEPASGFPASNKTLNDRSAAALRWARKERFEDGLGMSLASLIVLGVTFLTLKNASWPLVVVQAVFMLAFAGQAIRGFMLARLAEAELAARESQGLGPSVESDTEDHP